MMANSSINREERLGNRKDGRQATSKLFLRALHSIQRDKIKHEKKYEQYKPESYIQDSNNSKKSSNEHADDTVKQSKLCQEKVLHSNDKLHENPNKQFTNSRHSVDQTEDTPDCSTWTSKNSKLQSSSNNFSEYHINDGHNQNSQKFSQSSKSDFPHESSFLKSNTISVVNSCIETFKLDSSKHPESSNAYQNKILETNDEYSKNHVKSASNSRICSNTSPKKFNEDSSNFKKNSYSHKPYSHSNSKENAFYPSQHHNSYKKNFNRNPPRCDANFDTNNIKPSYKPNQNIKFGDDTEKDNFLDRENLNSENNYDDRNTEINHLRSFTKLNDTITINNETFINMKIETTFHDSVQNTSVSSSSSLSYGSNTPASPTSSLSTLSISSTPISPVSNISTVSVNLIASPIFEHVSAAESASNLTLPDMFDDSNLKNDSTGILISANDNFIPPPTSCGLSDASDKVHSNAEKKFTFLQNNGSESTEFDSHEEEAYLSLPDSEHLEAISEFILSIVKERSVSCSVAVTVVRDLNVVFKNNFEGNVIDYYGSYYTDLAITTSDINLMIKADVSIRKSFMYEVFKVFSKELKEYHVQHYEEGTTPHKSKINLTHPSTGINCELAYLGTKPKPDKVLNMGKFLKEMCSREHVRPLIIATKIWAEHYNINEAEDGKLHTIAFALLVVHFLQHCENPILPIYYPEKQDLEVLPHNDSSIGALWLGFMWYYAHMFNWQEDILTVTSVNRVSKKSKKWDNYWIAIEDPFTNKNIAESVTNKDVADRIKTCFKKTYDYFLNAQESFPDEDNDNASLLEFSFNDCVLEQDENICEKCEEMDDVCDECTKKIYVPPMASVPKMTDDFLKVIRRALLAVYQKYMLSDEEICERRQFVTNLENYVRKVYPDAEMKLFGSSANGFAFKKSDLDINITFKSPKEHKASTVLSNLRRHLRNNFDFTDVIALFKAQIPVLKFRYSPQGWRCDVSLDNVLAIHNSELLYMYTLLDIRCKFLGCALKLIAKKAQIADTTEKALSSYSYAIMVIHFLQQTDPPVLPVLQDLQFRDNFELGHVVDNCNVWFCQNIDTIKKEFKAENNTSVEQLFLDLLDYYCSFDCNNVITISQKDILPLASYEKMRSARLFNIQDPFIVSKNLGCVVSPTKAQETKSVFNRARMLFRTPKKEPQTDDLEAYFFSTTGLTGRIQKEVLCDLCGKFGHDEKDCRQSFLLKINNFKPFPRKNFSQPYRKYQYANRNDFVRSNHNNFFKMNKPCFMKNQ